MNKKTSCNRQNRNRYKCGAHYGLNFAQKIQTNELVRKGGGGHGSKTDEERPKTQKIKKMAKGGMVMVVSRQLTSCTYRDRVIFLLSPLKPSEEKF